MALSIQGILGACFVRNRYFSGIGGGLGGMLMKKKATLSHKSGFFRWHPAVISHLVAGRYLDGWQ